MEAPGSLSPSADATAVHRGIPSATLTAPERVSHGGIKPLPPSLLLLRMDMGKLRVNGVQRSPGTN